jgi:hypothetical protein
MKVRRCCLRRIELHLVVFGERERIRFFWVGLAQEVEQVLQRRNASRGGLVCDFPGSRGCRPFLAAGTLPTSSVSQLGLA